MISVIEKSTTYKVVFDDNTYIVEIVEQDKDESITIKDSSGKMISDNHLFATIENYIDKILEE